jgi:radical SAM superfamily enzyme YgiQ (UPF0313 family)
LGVESTQDATLRSMNKGFTVEQTRQRFAVIGKSQMVINAYFIVGNIGESEEQMLSTAPFARSLGADLIHVSRLRSEAHSGVAELVQQAPGYHIDEKGFVYSDAYPSEYVADLRKRIDRQFYSPRHVAHVVWKIMRLLHWRMKLRALWTMPVFVAVLVATQSYRKTRKWFARRFQGGAEPACAPSPPARTAVPLPVRDKAA